MKHSVLDRIIATGVVAGFLLLGLCGCAAPPPVSNACGWEQVIHLSPGFQSRLTHDEKVQIAAHNRDVHAFCHI